MFMNLLLKLFLFAVMFNKNVFLTSTLENIAKLENTMLGDIESAFKGITNTTENLLRTKIIPKMYNLTRSHTFLFKIPNMKSKLGYSMIFTDRSELLQPVFPNLTINHEQVALKKYQSDVRHTKGSNINKPISSSDIWMSLGLSGWSGELTEATYLLESEHKDFLQVDQSKMKNSTFEETRTKENSNSAYETNLDKSGFKSIYIARVNDPFGFSTKWAYRNQSKDIKSNNTMIANKDVRLKRDIVELYSMIKCATGCEPLIYKSYGCFCGFLGNGVAVDGIDKCCRMHDKCYEHSNCVSYLQYFVPYVWKCYRKKPLCAIDHGEYGGATSCAALLCYCDMKLSLCLRKFQCPVKKAVCTTSIARKLQNLFL